MKRDMDLIRKLLLEIEKLPATGGLYTEHYKLDNYNNEDIRYNALLLLQNDLVVGTRSMERCHTVSPCFIQSLTWDGHDFLDACRDKTRWEKAKGIFDQAGGVSFEVAKNVLTNLATDAVNKLI